MSLPAKQLVLVRRLATQTRSEFFDYHYQQHGQITARGDPKDIPPIYYQTHFFDSAYSATSSSHPAWTGHDDLTEIYYPNVEAMRDSFQTEYMRTVVGPDGANFIDIPSVIPIIAEEEVLHGSKTVPDPDTHEITAQWWVQAADPDAEHAKIAKQLNSLVSEAFTPVSNKVVANIALPDEEHILDYFKANGAPQYAAAYQIYLSGKDQIPAFRKALKQLEKKAEGIVDLRTTIVLFGVRALVYDQTRGIKLDLARQPKVL